MTDRSHAEASLERLRHTEPMLNGLADALLDTEANRWNVLIGDDTGGRLPARYVRKVLEADGREFDTFFVTGSKQYRDEHDESVYDAYFSQIAETVGEPLRPLIVTESAQSGQTLQYLKDRLKPHSSSEPEIAALAASWYARKGVTYTGQTGPAAMEEILYAYESVGKMSLGKRALKKTLAYVPMPVVLAIKQRTTARLVTPAANRIAGIEPDLSSELPVARRSIQRDAQLARAAFGLMDELALRYADMHGLDGSDDTDKEPTGLLGVG